MFSVQDPLLMNLYIAYHSLLWQAYNCKRLSKSDIFKLIFVAAKIICHLFPFGCRNITMVRVLLSMYWLTTTPTRRSRRWNCQVGVGCKCQQLALILEYMLRHSVWKMLLDLWTSWSFTPCQQLRLSHDLWTKYVKIWMAFIIIYRIVWFYVSKCLVFNKERTKRNCLQHFYFSYCSAPICWHLPLLHCSVQVYGCWNGERVSASTFCINI